MQKGRQQGCDDQPDPVLGTAEHMCRRLACPRRHFRKSLLDVHRSIWAALNLRRPRKHHRTRDWALEGASERPAALDGVRRLMARPLFPSPTMQQFQGGVVTMF